MTSSLYETDYYLWLKTTVHHLRDRDFSAIEWENLIEELESIGKSEKRALQSLLTRLLEHLFKLAYWESEKARSGNHWASEIVNFRDQIQAYLKDSPSLRSQLPILYDISLRIRLKFEFNCYLTLIHIL